MPILEHACNSFGCDLYRKVVEHYYPHADTPLPPCEGCGGPQVPYISRANFIYGGDMSRYVDRRIEDGDRAYQENGAHFVMRKNNLREGKKPHQVYITNRQEQLAYCKAEGLQDPADFTRDAAIDSDGKYSNSQGMPGSWV
jgi:hypothetical protein